MRPLIWDLFLIKKGDISEINNRIEMLKLEKSSLERALENSTGKKDDSSFNEQFGRFLILIVHKQKRTNWRLSTISLPTLWLIAGCVNWDFYTKGE